MRPNPQTPASASLVVFEKCCLMRFFVLQNASILGRNVLCCLLKIDTDFSPQHFEQKKGKSGVSLAEKMSIARWLS
jgi:hypothetical protein